MLLALIIVGGMAADPVMAKKTTKQYSKAKISQYQKISQTNVSSQSGGGTQVNVQSNSNTQSATATASNSGGGGGSGGLGDNSGE